MHLLQPSFKDGGFEELCEKVRTNDPSFKFWLPYFTFACKHLEKHGNFHSLYEVQLFIRVSSFLLGFCLLTFHFFRNFTLRESFYYRMSSSRSLLKFQSSTDSLSIYTFFSGFFSCCPYMRSLLSGYCWPTTNFVLRPITSFGVPTKSCTTSGAPHQRTHNSLFVCQPCWLLVPRRRQISSKSRNTNQ